jgi:hypothetical protein
VKLEALGRSIRSLIGRWRAPFKRKARRAHAGYTVVAFHTPEYDDCAGPFRAQCARLGLDCTVLRLESTGDWERNTGLKPTALRQLREQIKGPMLYFDIDAVIFTAPQLPPGQWDLAVADNPAHWHLCRIAAQVIFIGDTPGARRFLQRWQQRLQKRPGKDHPEMIRAIEIMKAAQPPVVFADATAYVVDRWRMNGLRQDRPQDTATPEDIAQRRKGKPAARRAQGL